jgi:phosphoserine aminotransferase
MKIYNFAAGPAMLPAEVMKKAQEEFCAYQDSGSGLMELSHRGKYFQPVIDRAEANVRELLGLTDEYSVLFIQGGASMQFAMIPMNLLNGGTADVVETGVWSKKAAKEARKEHDLLEYYIEYYKNYGYSDEELEAALGKEYIKESALFNEVYELLTANITVSYKE